jgi:hypothetical protein
MGIQRIICRKIEYKNLHEIDSSTDLNSFDDFNVLKTSGTSKLEITEKKKAAGVLKEEKLIFNLEHAVSPSFSHVAPKLFRLTTSKGESILLGDFGLKTRFQSLKDDADKVSYTYKRTSCR